jgi:hypothetical protein
MLGELSRVRAVRARQDREASAHATTQLELLIDTICAETGLRPTRENLPTFLMFIEHFFEQQAAQREQRNDSSLLDGFDEQSFMLPDDASIRRAIQKRERETKDQGPRTERV